MVQDTVVPRLIPQPKWFRIDEDLKVGDIVYFQKQGSDLGESWTVGEVDQIVKGRDGLIRRAIIKYFNAEENDPVSASYRARFTDRAVRSLVKLWSLDECTLFEDLGKLGSGEGTLGTHTGLIADDCIGLIGNGGSSSLVQLLDRSKRQNMLEFSMSLIDGTTLNPYSYTNACNLNPICGRIATRNDVEFIDGGHGDACDSDVTFYRTYHRWKIEHLDLS